MLVLFPWTLSGHWYGSSHPPETHFSLAFQDTTSSGFPCSRQPLLRCHLILFFPISNCPKSSEPCLQDTPLGTTPFHPTAFLAFLNRSLLYLSLQNRLLSQAALLRKMALSPTQVLWPENWPSNPHSLPHQDLVCPQVLLIPPLRSTSNSSLLSMPLPPSLSRPPSSLAWAMAVAS